MKIIECPRDAMQGWPHFIATPDKTRYINALLKVGFDTIDFGSQALCNAERLSRTLILQNTGCMDLEIESVQLELDQQPQSDFTFTPVEDVTLRANGDPIALPTPREPLCNISQTD